MFKKTCTLCNKSSYSSNDKGKWICPYCANDLTLVQAKVAEEKPADHKVLNGKTS